MSLFEVIMSISSARIRKLAKVLHKQNNSRKLTDYQNKLAILEGFSSYKHLLSQENANIRADLARFSRLAADTRDNLIQEFSDSIGLFLRADGRRGLVALKDFKTNEVLFREKPYLWLYFGEDELGEGLSWALTRKIAVNMPEALDEMQKILRESFKPKLATLDKTILADIAHVSGMHIDKVNVIYNIVCTYNIRTSIFTTHDGTLAVGERISICRIASHVNHACDPNACRLTPKSIDMFKLNYEGMFALKDIHKGEEITWSYFRDEIPVHRKNRQNILKQEFGFECTCGRCQREKTKTTDT